MGKLEVIRRVVSGDVGEDTASFEARYRAGPFRTLVLLLPLLRLLLLTATIAVAIGVPSAVAAFLTLLRLFGTEQRDRQLFDLLSRYRRSMS